MTTAEVPFLGDRDTTVHATQCNGLCHVTPTNAATRSRPAHPDRPRPQGAGPVPFRPLLAPKAPGVQVCVYYCRTYYKAVPSPGCLILEIQKSRQRTLFFATCIVL